MIHDILKLYKYFSKDLNNVTKDYVIPDTMALQYGLNFNSAAFVKLLKASNAPNISHDRARSMKEAGTRRVKSRSFIFSLYRRARIVTAAIFQIPLLS